LLLAYQGFERGVATFYDLPGIPLRGKPCRIFELGLGTDNPNLPCNMGAYGRPGASLRGWRELLPHAQVFGADIDRAILFQEDRIETFYCDQLDQEAVRELWSQPVLRGGADIIIDDGLHSLEANVSFFEGSIKHLNPGGLYVVEDIDTAMLGRWKDKLKVYSQRNPTLVFALVILPNPVNSIDNNLLVVRRSPTDYN
jgi:hypothetical protein